MKELTVTYAKSNLVKGSKLVVNYRYGSSDDFAKIGDVVTYSRVNDGECIFVTNSKGVTQSYFAWRFDVDESFVRPTVKEQIILAQSYVGKTVMSGEDKITITKWSLIPMGESSSMVVEQEADKHGYCVAVIGSQYTVPVLSVTLPPQEITIKLNDDYDAIITKETVKVGCQTFPVALIKEIQSAIDKLNEQ